MRMNRPGRLSLTSAVIAEIVILATLGSYLLPGGQDLYLYYLPFARGCLSCGFAPYHAAWILFPLTLVPEPLAAPLLTFITLVGLVAIARRVGGNPLVVLLAFPTFAQVWLGQIDVIVAAGLAIALTARSPYWRGAGLVLASIKPQTAGAAILILLWVDRDRWRVLLLPALVFALSLIVYGPDWPLRWLLESQRPPEHLWRTATLYPLGLAAFAALFWLRGRREKMTGALLASALGIPFYGSYAYVTFLPFISPIWAVPASYLWLLAYPLEGRAALHLAWILPLALLLYLLRPALKMGLSHRAGLHA